MFKFHVYAMYIYIQDLDRMTETAVRSRRRHSVARRTLRKLRNRIMRQMHTCKPRAGEFRMSAWKFWWRSYTHTHTQYIIADRIHFLSCRIENKRYGKRGSRSFWYNNNIIIIIRVRTTIVVGGHWRFDHSKTPETNVPDSAVLQPRSSSRFS